MSAAHSGRTHSSYQAIIAAEQAYDNGGVPTGQASRQRRQSARVHPVLYLFSVISAAILLSLAVAALAGYAPPTSHHLPREHDELLAWQQQQPADQHQPYHPADGVSLNSNTDGRLAAARARPDRNNGLVSASWNSIASALGGFSSAYITSPQLNATWIARPAGFGPRVVGEVGLLGKLDYLRYEDYVSASSLNADAVTSSRWDRTACHSVTQAVSTQPNPGGNSSVRIPRIALIERGGCPFVTKVLNAQALGFDAAIVHNDYSHSARPRNGFEGDAMHDYTDEDELISMWSPLRDAAYVHIPSVFVSYLTGSMLQGLLAVEHDDKQEAIVILEPESPPHLLLMDIIIVLFFLPMVFTTVVLIFTRIRQIRHRAQQRAPVSLVESLPAFKWREGLDLNLDALATGEKDVPSQHGEYTAESAGMDSRLVQLVTRALRRPAPPGDGISSRHAVIPVKKARHIAKKIFQQKECAICLADFIHDDDVRLLPCGHLFHKTEIDLWLTEQKRWCPVCRFSIDGSDEEERLETPSSLTANAAAPVATAGSATQAQPIVLPEEIDTLLQEEDDAPVASSSGSTANERTPLLRSI